MNALKLKKQASAYNKKRHRDLVLKEYKLLKKRIRAVSKNGQYEYVSPVFDVELSHEEITAYRLFLRKQKGFKYSTETGEVYRMRGMSSYVKFIISWD